MTESGYNLATSPAFANLGTHVVTSMGSYMDIILHFLPYVMIIGFIMWLISFLWGKFTFFDFSKHSKGSIISNFFKPKTTVSDYNSEYQDFKIKK